MKSEYHIMERCKQPIKIEKLLQCILTFSYRVSERNIPQTVLLSLFFSFYFLSALHSDNNSNTLYFGSFSELLLTLA